MSHPVARPLGVDFNMSGTAALAAKKLQSVGSLPAKKQAGESALVSMAPSAAVQQRLVSSADPANTERGTFLSKEAVMHLLSKIGDVRTDAEKQQADMLDPKNLLSGVVTATFMWRKPLSEAEHKVRKSEAELAGHVYTPSKIPAAPMDFTFDVATWNAAFGGKVEFSKARYLHSMTIEMAHNSSPLMLNYLVSGVQGKPLARVHSNKGAFATAVLPPATTLTNEQVIYSMDGVDTAKLYAFGNIDMEKEVASLMCTDDSNTFMVPAQGFIGKVIAANIDTIQKTDPVEYVPRIDMYLAEENVIANIIGKFNAQVLDGLKPTDFSAITASLTRDDQVSSQSTAAAAFSDLTDAPGLGSLAARENAHKAVQMVKVNMRVTIIDPAKLRTDY